MKSIDAKGFRPFFLLAGVQALIAMGLWLASLGGALQLDGALSGLRWHAHEMVHGFTVAVIAGFLLTAVGNWTGRETLVGMPLRTLAGLWLAARLALLFDTGLLGPLLDLSFLPLLALAIGRPLWATRNLRNAAFPGLLMLLWACNLASWLDPALAPRADRFAIYVIQGIILLVAGRIVPMFTRNTTGVAEIRNRPGMDTLALAAAGAVALLSLVPGATTAMDIAAAVAGVAVLARASTWGFVPALRVPMLWVLHLGHAFIGLGYMMQALSALWPLGSSLPLHAMTVGGIGMLTLGMMARVGLGHTGRTIRAHPVIALAFGALGLAALVRVLGPLLLPDRLLLPWMLAGGLWILAFAAFVVVYLPILLAPRPDGKAG